ncbi:DUF177 domain-containing protein [bacterium]|nr:DUF177 domain-containing protein [bacterium]
MLSISVTEIEQKQKVNFDENVKIDELQADVSAKLCFENLGEFIKVSGNIKGSLPLTCDRCLSEYNFDFNSDIEEIYAKNSLYDEYKPETELKEGQFITDLEGKKEIDVYDLLYQSVILTLPNKKVCGINCNMEHFMSEDELKTDTRMDVFKNIEISRKQ